MALSQADFPSAHRYVLYFLKRMLEEWEEALEQRPADVRRSLQGKVDSATQKQTRESLRPLFLLLKAQSVDADILQRTAAIAEHCREGAWSKADEAYLTMAIGNAPWPMGVTMVGIPRAQRTREDIQRPRGARPQRRDGAEIHSGHQAPRHILQGTLPQRMGAHAAHSSRTWRQGRGEGQSQQQR